MLISPFLRFLPFFIIVLIPSMCLAWSGKVVGISDGDSITVLHEKKPVRIRFYDIDYPNRICSCGICTP